MKRFEIREPWWLWIILGTAVIALPIEAVLYWLSSEPEGIFGIVLAFSSLVIPVVALVFAVALVIRVWRTANMEFESVSDFCEFCLGSAGLALVSAEFVLVCTALFIGIFGDSIFGNNSSALATKFFLTGTLFNLLVGVPVFALGGFLFGKLVLWERTLSRTSSRFD